MRRLLHIDAPKALNRDETGQVWEHSWLGPIEAWNHSQYDARSGILDYKNSYRVVETGRTVTGSARIRYTPVEALAVMIGEVGLAVETWVGDWDGGPFRPGSSEIIPLGRLA